ncbi:nonribosomal peptide synthase-like protein [Mytilinidion resinicola]|uniref:Nonribosomal peptide synthase-like protein n=1 Tax=Mytilinidion resinicola TaxID=574789 RepID=A0A6A6Y2P7_9PEZI|nr:nonribosomal peptide synthase-like protein [Mytilinidion resinicola]KAF2802919.1 nonribosomal peptide synthase-like protein [Mytilinidion resinicola]
MDEQTFRLIGPSVVIDDGPVRSASALENALKSIWSHVLNLSHEQVGLNHSFLKLGGDSISSMQVAAQARRKGIGLSVQDILLSKSIVELAQRVKEVHSPYCVDEEEIEKPFDLSPIQLLYFELPNQGTGHFNQSFFLRVARKLSKATIHGAVRTLVSRHSMLRARFECEAGCWHQRVTNEVTSSFSFRQHTMKTSDQTMEVIADAQTSLDPVRGPLFAVELFDLPKEQLIFLVGHHLVIDLVSWRVILEEFEELLADPKTELLPKPISFQSWCRLQASHSQQLEPSKLIPPANVSACDFGYWGINEQDNTYGNATNRGFEISKDLTSAFLSDCHTALNTEPIDVLLGILFNSWQHTFDDRDVPPIYNEHHGRETWDNALDISRVIGWFTTVYPVVAPSSALADIVEAIRFVKDYRRKVPSNGRPYFAKRCLTNEGGSAFQSHWPWEVSFNYLGQYQQLERADSLLQPLETMAGESRAAGGAADVGFETPRFGLFEISTVVSKGKLRFSFSYNRHMQHQQLIQRWITACEEMIGTAVQRLRALSPALSLGDFPLLPWTLNGGIFQSMLENLSQIRVAPSDVENIYPCSSIQEGLLLSQGKHAGYYAAAAIYEVVPQGYNTTVTSEKLAAAWNRCVQRHPSLRTIFLENTETIGGLYYQVVLKHASPAVAHLSCKDEEEALSILLAQRSISYEDKQSPAHRFTICNIMDKKIVCSLEISHALMDGDSMDIIFRDLAKAYQQPLPKGPLYSEYIEYLQSQNLGIDYWNAYLHGVEVCTFPVLNDGLREEKRLRTIRLDLQDINIPAFNQFCHENSITMSNIFHAAWALTLGCYVGSGDVCFGYLTSGRVAQGIQGVNEMVGLLINSLVCRVKIHGSSSVLDILRSLQEDYIKSLPHRYTPLADIQHALNLSGTALFNTAISYRRLPSRNEHHLASDISFNELAPIYDPTEYPVSLNIEVHEDVASIDLDFWTDHLSETQAENVASTLSRVLHTILDEPDKQIDDLDLLSHHNLEQISRWNIMPETLNECVHTKFLEQVTKQPNAPAICAFDGNFTYAELDSISERLAHSLVELGVGPEMFVPTCFDKSSYAVIAMLGVLKAGGAAVPLDASHPKAALESRIADTGSGIVLASPHRATTFEDVVPTVLAVSSGLLDQLPMVEGRACTTVQPYNPAFVIFTSGSTGRPKGVVLQHDSMTTSCNAHGTNLGIGPGTRFLQFASYTFDNSLEEMFTTIQRGGCVCIPSEEQRMNDLPGAIRELNANFMDLTPTVASLLEPAEVPSIKGLALGGEALTKSVVDRWVPFVHVHGQYGPSEASINSAWKDFQDGGDPTNIGRAIASVSWIVHPDNPNHLMPIGCQGELLIEGPILSRGYLNDPEKTSKAFIQNLGWAKETGQKRRFYKTGDLVRYNSNGEMMYLGRKDNQVKVNGQRIELGEVEHHLKLSLPTEAQSAVELITVGDQTSTLAAFICLPTTASQLDETEISTMTDSYLQTVKCLQTILANALPASFLPKLYIPVNSMPFTSSGKLDRKVLRNLAHTIPNEDRVRYTLSGRSAKRPSTPREICLAQLWEAVLKLDANSVGADDSFFSLGGDSVCAMRLVVASRKEGLSLTVGSIFRSPRLSDMALDAGQDTANTMELQLEAPMEPFSLVRDRYPVAAILEMVSTECGLSSDRIEDVYPCSKLQEGLIALSLKEPGAYVAETVYNLPKDIDISGFRKAWDAVVREEAILRTRILFTEAYGFLQVVIRDEGIEWGSMLDLQDIKESDRHLPAVNGGKLTSYAIVGEGSMSPHFVWTAHHAVYVVDGWSLALLFRKVELRYRGANAESKIAVPYARFINYLTQSNQEESDRYWTSQLVNPSTPQFPQLPSYTHQVRASGFLSHSVQICRVPGSEITMACIIRAAWTLVISAFTGEDDVIFGETNNGREAPVPGIEDILGPTITTLPRRVVLNRKMKVLEFLREIQQNSVDSLPYQFAGLQHIKRTNSENAQACDFQNLLAINSENTAEDSGHGLWNLESTGAVGTNFFSYPLIMSCTMKANEVNVECHYDQEVIATWLTRNVLQEFDFLLQCLNSPRNHDTAIQDLVVLNPEDQLTLTKWNSRPLVATDKCIHSAVFQQVLIRPTDMAVDAFDLKITYRELDEKSTRLASRLVAEGITPGCYVPFCFEKSGCAIVSMLGILKAGAAFVGLDPTSPIRRLREIVGDVNAKLVLCSPQLSQICESIPVKALLIDTRTIEQQSGRLYTLPYVQSDTPAYAIYTSGSTGRPKGTVIHHSSFVLTATESGPKFGISSQSRVLQFASFVFDACLIEIFTTLMCGGCVCVPTEQDRTNDLARTINDLAVNWAILTPTVIRTIHPKEVPNLKTLALGGEAMSSQDLTTWAEAVKLVNGYGPTESSVVATINQSMRPNSNPSNIGYAVGCHSWIVAKGNPNVLLPVGAVGELVIEGPSLAWGYLNNSQKTQEVFVMNLSWAKGHTAPGNPLERRFYKTGDLVSYSHDGSMIFHGRKDLQSKVRGQRLELTEVESHLNADPSVRDCMAVVPSFGLCGKRLVGILTIKDLVVSKTSAEPDTKPVSIIPARNSSFHVKSIRDRLAERVPTYMIPSVWVAIVNFPLLASAKMDRKTVIKYIEGLGEDEYHQISAAGQEDDASNPASEVEQKLQAIAGHILNIPSYDIGIYHQSFLNLGGDSISAMQFSARCKLEGLIASVQDIIQSRSLSELASKVRLAPAEQKPALEEDLDRPFPLSPIQRLFLETVGENYKHFNQSVVLRSDRKIESQDLEKAITALVETHPMLRARFQKSKKGLWHQHITSQVSGSFQIVHHALFAGTERAIGIHVQEKIADSQLCLGIESGPLLAVDSFDISGSNSQIVSLVIHHLVVDVVSWGIILGDLETLLTSGFISPQSLSFPAWSNGQYERAHTNVAVKAFPLSAIPTSNLEYWGMPNQKDLHSDVVSQGFQLSARDSMLLFGAHDAVSTEPLDVFIAALLESFRRVFPDRATPAIFSEGHGREPWNSDQNLSRTCGWFTTLTPVSLPVGLEESDIVSTIQWVKSLRSKTPQRGREYFAYRHLTEEGQQRHISHQPEIIFNYLGRMQNLDRKDSLFRRMNGITTSDVGADVPRFAPFEVTASVKQNKIDFSFSWNRLIRHQERVGQWISKCQAILQEAIEVLLQERPEPPLERFNLLPLIYNGTKALDSKLPQISNYDQIEDIYPTSAMQQGLLLSQLKNPKLYAYHTIFEIGSLHPSGLVDAKKVALAWEHVVQRHPSLRTLFIPSLSGSGPMDQVVLRRPAARISWVECEGAKAFEALKLYEAISYADSFELPHRFSLCVSSAHRVFCKLEMSHAICDGTSIAILLHELSESYRGMLPSEQGPDYSDYISHLLESPQDDHINYWKTHLSGLEPCIVPPLTDGHSGVREVGSVKLTLKGSRDVNVYCKRNSVTMSTLLQFVWAMVLRCYVGSEDVCFGYLSSGRDVPVRGVEKAVGCFIQMLVCRLSLGSEITVSQALGQIQGDLVKAMAHQNCSLAEVNHSLGLAASFNTAFTFQRRSFSPRPTKTGLFFEVLEAEDPGEYAVTVNTDASDDGITLDLSFWKDKISRDHAENMAHTYQHIFSSIVRSDDINLTIGSIDCFSDHSRSKILRWNKHLPETIDRCVHEIIMEQTMRDPQKQAVVGWDANFTYQELDKLSDTLANSLVSSGVSTESYIPILFEKSSWTIVSILAVLKAGGAFVPLDSRAPTTRLQQLVTDVDAKFLLCSQKFQETAKNLGKYHVVDRTSIKRLQHGQASSPILRSGPSDTAYIIFTSGTTGTPKGVMISHSAFSTSATEHTKAMNLSSASRVLQFASYSFDASVMEILSTLVVGGCVCVPSDEERMNDISAAIQRMGANWALLTPSVASTIKPSSVPCLRTLVTGGEAMNRTLIEQWSDGVGRCLINAYGPSETSVIATTSVKSDASGNIIDQDSSNIGQATGGRCWVVDSQDHDRLMPIGAVGELTVEGATVARGYLRDQIKSARAFVTPSWMTTVFAGVESTHCERMYKTGDLVRSRNDGSFTFIGRKDTQVKLNGQRIEIGEIEHQIRAGLPADFQSAVELVAPASSSATKALAVFFCAPEEFQSSDDDSILMPLSKKTITCAKNLENFLASVLPLYMIPSLYVSVRSMPFTSSGKLDRNRLRNAVQNIPTDELMAYRLANVVKKRSMNSEKERRMQRAWAQVLAITDTSIGPDDNFFTLGGDSVVAMRLVKAAQAERIEISVIDIFRHPIFSELVEECSDISQDGSHLDSNPSSLLGKDQYLDIIEELADQCGTESETIQNAYPASPLQEAFITLSIKQPGAYVASTTFNIPLDIDIPKFKKAWETTVQDLDILRTRIIHTKSSEFIQVVLREDRIIWHEDDFSRTTVGEIPQLPARNGGRLTHYSILANRQFVWTIHHSLYDGWSMPLMLKRVEEIYLRGSSSIPDTPYFGFINYLANSDPEASKTFWATRLRGATPLQFPQPQSSGSKKIPNGQTVNHVAKYSRRKDDDIPVSAYIRAAWATVISAYTNSEDVIFGETRSGRDINVAGITEICGPTLTTVPMRIHIDRQSTVRQLLNRLVQQTADTIPHQHVGIGAIKRFSTDAAAACDFQNLLVIQAGEFTPDEDFWKPQSDGPSSNFFTYPLVLECNLESSGVDIDAHYDANLLSEWQVRRLLHQFESALSHLNTSKSMTEVQILSNYDLNTIKDWNSSEPHVVSETADALFEQEVRAHPNTVAICAWDGDFTYQTLYEKATQLSQYLQLLGIGPETLVPLCVDKSKWAVVAIMGVLLAGGAYVPLSPEHPISRHQQIIEDVNATVLLCSRAYKTRYDMVRNVIPIDDHSFQALPVVTAKIPTRSKAHNTSYVTYTSGSTGTPTRVVITHQAFCSSSTALQKALHITSKSRVFQFASLVFDVSVMEILAVLTCGATICMPSEDQRTKDVAGAINNLKASWAFLTPSIANSIDGPFSVPTLQTLVVGGDAMTPETIEKWADGVELMNGYGPTEAAIICVANPSVSQQRDPSNLGHMLDAGRSWIVSPEDHDLLVPVGAIGELCIEGPLLAREYLNAKTRTGEAFFKNPAWIKDFSTARESQTRFYKTGDLVHYGSDGSIIYVGRKDQQVKLAGQRMELGEIEHNIQADSMVRDVVVALPQTGPCLSRLVAVVTLKDSANRNTIGRAWNELLSRSETSAVAAIREKLLDKLPAYMVPAVWVAVNALPTLLSSKIDRKQVAAWLEELSDETYQRIVEMEMHDELGNAPSATITSQVLASIWSRVLNIPVEKIKPNQTWLALGGDSLTGMQVLARARTENIGLTLHDVLRSRSVFDLAERARALGGSSSANDVERPDEPFDLSPIQTLYFQNIHNGLVDSHFNQSFTLSIERHFDLKDFDRALKVLVNRHGMLRARFQKEQNGSWRQRILSNDGQGLFRCTTHVLNDTAEISSWIGRSQRSLDIERGPVFAVDLFSIPAKDHVISLVAHHLVVDVMSWRVILNDLEELLTATPVEDKPLSFQTWCAKQADRAVKQRTIPEGPKSLPFEVIPADFKFWGMEVKANVYADVEYESFLVDKNASDLALNNHHALRTDVVDILLAAITHSFTRVFMTRSLPTIYNEGHGREPWESSNLDLSRTIGWFTTLTPIQVSIGQDEDDVLETLMKCKDYRRSIVDKGRPDFARSILTEDGRKVASMYNRMEILFNYLGKMQQLEHDDSLFRPVTFAEEENKTISDVGPKTCRLALFEISASAMSDGLRVTFMYNRHMKQQKGIRRWISECHRTLKEIVRSIAGLKAPQPTLSDFPLLPLKSYDRLEKLVKSTFPIAGVTSYGQVEDIYPCVPIQEGMLLSQVKNSGSYLFHTISDVRPAKNGSSQVDIKRLAKAWQQLVNYHPALRTVFVDSVCRGGVFDQIVLKETDCGAITLHCDDADVSVRLGSISLADLNKKRKPPLPHQVTICQTSSGRVIFKMEINHTVIDGGSQDIILRDLAAAYDGRLSADSGPLYSDYVKYLRSRSVSADEKYWTTYLNGLQPCIFPLSQQTEGPREQRTTLMDFDRYSEMQTLCEKNSVTLSNVMLSAWAWTLRLFTGSMDVCYGYLASGRDIPIDGIQDAVGAFLNMLIFRHKFRESSTPVEVFKNVQNDFIASLSHQHNSLAQIQHDLGLEGKTLFNTAVSIQNHSGSGSVDHFSIEFEQTGGYDPSEYAVTVNVETGRNDEGVLFRYWTDTLSDEQANKLSSTMASLMNSFIDDPNTPITKVSQPARNFTRPSTENQEGQAVLPSPPSTDLRELPYQPQSQDWSTLVRSIVNEIVPEIIDQIIAQRSLEPYHDSAKEMVDSISQSASQVGQMKELISGFESGNRKMSVTENRISIAADMVAAAGVMATEAVKSVPADFVEKKLLQLWSELLETVEGSIDKEDSFFQLGGDSIVAMRLVGAAREEGLSMTVADVFKNPTFADMARVVRAAGEVIDEVMTQKAYSGYNPQDVPESSKELRADISRTLSHRIRIRDSHEQKDLRSGDIIDTWSGFSKHRYSKAHDTKAPRPTHRDTEEELRRTISFIKNPSATSAEVNDSPIQDSIISKVRVFKGGISDVLPVTDFQALAITGALLESKWMLNHFYLTGQGPLDLKRLKQSAFRLVQAFDIMRTVFVPYRDRFLQVVLRKLQPDFVVLETELDLDAFTMSLQEKDRETGPRPGETFMQFVVATRKGIDQHRIFMRLSHAQYDGICMPQILGALQAGYNGQPIPSAPSFANYVRESTKNVTRQHYAYWKTLLHQSTMTAIVPHEQGPNYRRTVGVTITLKQIIRVASLSHYNITPATVIKAAWSSTLARLTSQQDVVFGQVISGRNTTVPGVESIIGPCLNMVPVRVKFQNAWTILDLLRYIQDQQVANMPFESLGFREITKHCTNWPDWTNFSSVLQHQNIAREVTMNLGATEYKVGAVGTQEDFADFTIVSSPLVGEKVEISLSFAPNSTITPTFAEKVHNTLCEAIASFAENPRQQLPSVIVGISPQRVIDEDAIKPVIERAFPTTCPPLEIKGLSQQEVAGISNMLRGAWQEILRDDRGRPVPLELHSSFFELGGDIMGLAQVCSLLDQEGFSLRVEDLIDHPVLVEQLVLMAAQVAREKESETASPWGTQAMSETEPQAVEEKPRNKVLNAVLVKSAGLARKIVARRRVKDGVAEL